MQMYLKNRRNIGENDKNPFFFIYLKKGHQSWEEFFLQFCEEEEKENAI